jgi:radical SAM superfamily enzyme YgiQ (UPF0313 family)
MDTQKNFRFDALLVGYENQENLGLRSIVAYLLAQGYRAKLVPFYPGRYAETLAVVHELNPRLVGFSLIFQYALEDFGNLMRYLRTNGVRSHFTAGGHFPTLRPDETLKFLPELDSVVRFEGELTLPELLESLDTPRQWERIQGLAFRQGEKIVMTPPRPLVADLDILPTVCRDQPREAGVGVRMASMLASRGCLFNCSFCSIRQFYGGARGALRRVRSPQAVVDEMQLMFNEKSVRFFTFQDDDFAARTSEQRKWLERFLLALNKSGMTGQVRWKISCRVDDPTPEILEAMLGEGLMAVYLGVESGSEEGLKTLNKYVSVGENLSAVELLKQYDVALAIGFMLFDPSSTVKTVRENISFLRTVGEDGYFPVNFCKMLPYAGTPVEGQLQSAGRLKGTHAHPDYDFLDPQLDWYAFLVQRIFTRRNFSPEGLVARLQQADFDYRLASAFGYGKNAGAYGTKLRHLISRSNRLALDALVSLLDEVSYRGAECLLEEQKTLLGLAEQVWHGEAMIEAELDVLQMTWNHLVVGEAASASFD